MLPLSLFQLSALLAFTPIKSSILASFNYSSFCYQQTTTVSQDSSYHQTIMSLKPDLNNSSKSDNRTGSPWAIIDSGPSGPDLISFNSDVEIGTAEPDLINFDSDAENDWTTIDDGSPWASPDLDIFGPNLISFDSDIEIETAGPNLVNLNPDVEIGTADSNQTITGTIDTDIETSDSDWTDVEVTEMDTDFSITSSECSHQLVVNMMTQTDDNDVVQAADMDSTDSRPASLRCPESGNTDDEIQVSFSHAELALNLNERFTQYRERTKSFIQHSQDDGVVGEDRDSGMVHLTPRPPQLHAAPVRPSLPVRKTESSGFLAVFTSGHFLNDLM